MDARTHLLHPVDLPATITSSDGEVACSVRNISIGGAFVAGVHVPIETRVVLRFTLPHRAELEVACTAQWSSVEGTALRFDDLRAAETYALARYIRADGLPTSRTPISEILRGLPPR